MSLRIACDLDGTVADMDAALQREAERLFGPGVDLHGSTPPPDDGEAGDLVAEVEDIPPDFPQKRPLTSREMHRLWSHVRTIENFWMSLHEIEPGVVARLAALRDAHRWEVLFVTQRPATVGLTAQEQSQRWLRERGFELPAVMVMHGSRGQLSAALELDVVVDDRLENCIDVATASRATAMLVWRAAPDTLPPDTSALRITPVSSTSDALLQLEELSHRVKRRSSPMARVRRALGF